MRSENLGEEAVSLDGHTDRLTDMVQGAVRLRADGLVFWCVSWAVADRLACIQVTGWSNRLLDHSRQFDYGNAAVLLTDPYTPTVYWDQLMCCCRGVSTGALASYSPLRHWLNRLTNPVNEEMVGCGAISTREPIALRIQILRLLVPGDIAEVPLCETQLFR